MSDFEKGFFLGLVLMTLATILMCLIQECEYEKKAIEAGAAYYDSKTAEFKWGKP
jgi:hypothetical protein